MDFKALGIAISVTAGIAFLYFLALTFPIATIVFLIVVLFCAVYKIAYNEYDRQGKHQKRH